MSVGGVILLAGVALQAALSGSTVLLAWQRHDQVGGEGSKLWLLLAVLNAAGIAMLAIGNQLRQRPSAPVVALIGLTPVAVLLLEGAVSLVWPLTD